MRKVNNIFWVLSLLLITLYSCSTENINSVKLLKMAVDVSIEGTQTTTYLSYNGNKIISIDGVDTRSDFTYTGELITKIVVLEKVNQHQNTLDYIYLEGKLVKVNSTDNYVINFIHNTNGTVSYEKLTKDIGSNENKVFHGILYFQNENLIKDERIMDDVEAGILNQNSITLEYDYKNNPLNNILGYNKLLDHFKKISINNSISSFEVSKYENKEGQITSSAVIYKNVYKYDSEDYPIEMVSEKSFLNNASSNHVKSLLYY